MLGDQTVGGASRLAQANRGAFFMLARGAKSSSACARLQIPAQPPHLTSCSINSSDTCATPVPRTHASYDDMCRLSGEKTLYNPPHINHKKIQENRRDMSQRFSWIFRGESVKSLLVFFVNLL